jgi:hypothetical protein
VKILLGERNEAKIFKQCEANPSDKIGSLFLLDHGKTKRNGSLFASFRIEAKICLKRNRCTLPTNQLIISTPNQVKKTNKITRQVPLLVKKKKKITCYAWLYVYINSMVGWRAVYSSSNFKEPSRATA